MRSVGRDSHAARAPKTITTNHDAGKHGQTAFETPTTWRYALIRIFPAQDQRPDTRRTSTLPFSGRGRDPRGEVTRTLDDASESWTKANRENAGAVPTRGYRDKGCRWERAQRPRRGSRR